MPIASERCQKPGCHGQAQMFVIMPRSPKNRFSRRSQVAEQRVRSLWITICSRRILHGGSGVTAEHLKSILDRQTAELTARASMPEKVLRAIRVGRMTRGIAAGTSFGGWCRGPLRSRSGRRWRRPQHFSNMPCPRRVCVSALPMRPRR